MNLRGSIENLLEAVGEWIRSIANAGPVRKSIDRANAILEREVERLASAWKAAQEWYSKREQREKLLLRILGVVLGVIVLYDFIYLPIAGLGEGLGDRVAIRQQQLAEVRGMMRSYDRLKVELAATERRTVRSKDFSLFSIVEQSLSRTVGRDKVSSIAPSDRAVPGGFEQFMVDIKLSALSLGQIVDMLYGVQTLPMPVTVSSLHVRQRPQDPHSYDVDMTCMSLGRNG